MNQNISAPDRLLAGVIRASGLLPGLPPRPMPAIDDWEALLVSARSHSVIGLLYSALARAGALQAAPPEMREALRHAYVRILAGNARKLSALAEIAAELAARDVPLMAMKGCALAPTLYGDSGQRFIGDVDFLVHRDDIPTTLEGIVKLGFQPYELVFDADTRREQMGELSYARAGIPRVSLDVHWHIFNIPYFVRRVPVEWFWSNSMPATIAGQTVQVLNAEALMLHLCSHYVLHHVAMPHLRWSHDIALLLALHGAKIDWQKVIDSARSFSLLGVLQQVLAYVMALWDVQMDPAQQALVFGARLTHHERLISRLLVIQPLRPITDGLMTGSFVQRVHYWRDVVFPSEVFMRRRYGREVRGPLVFFYLRRLRNGMLRLLGGQP